MSFISHLCLPNVHLMYALGFNEEDLKANRAGQLSKSQWKRKTRSFLFWTNHFQEGDQVRVIKGCLLKTSTLGRKISISSISKDPVVFSVSEVAYNIFVQNDIYTLYYEPRTHTLLSAEYVEAENTPESRLRRDSGTES